VRHHGNSPAIARDDEHRISLGSGQAQVDDSVWLPVGFERFVVAGQTGKVIEHVHHHSVGRTVDRVSAQRAVDRTRGETDQDQHIDEVRKHIWCLWSHHIATLSALDLWVVTSNCMKSLVRRHRLPHWSGAQQAFGPATSPDSPSVRRPFSPSGHGFTVCPPAAVVNEASNVAFPGGISPAVKE
jgi:hypothetical protein